MAKHNVATKNKLWRKDLSGEGTWRIIGEYSIIGEIKEVDDTNLILAAINACIKINPDNPLAVAKSTEDMYTAIKATSSFLKALRKLDPKLFNDCRVTLLDTTIEQMLAKINDDGLFNPDIPNPSEDV